MPNLNRREFRAALTITPEDDRPGRFAIVAVRYNTPDTYGTTFAPGAFTESLEQRLPRICWNHDWGQVLGKVVAYDDNTERLLLFAQLSGLGHEGRDKIPECVRAYELMLDGVIEEFSIGFERYAQEDDPNHRDVTRITRAGIFETSLVLMGSVPGTELLAIRSGEPTRREARAAGKVVPLSIAEEVILRLELGEIDAAEALTQVKASLTDAPDPSTTTGDDPGDAGEPAGDGQDGGGDGNPGSDGGDGGQDGDGQGGDGDGAAGDPVGGGSGGVDAGDVAALDAEAAAALELVASRI